MKKEQAKKIIEDLSSQIEEHNYQYYVNSQPTISDKEYDDLLKKLTELENKFPELLSPSSPIQRVGTQISSDAKAIQHKTKMYSLDNTYSVEELNKWHQRVLKGSSKQEVEYIVELKIDGVSASLIYQNGEFTIGATRGDGLVGEDVSHSLKTIRSIPLSLRKSSKRPLPSELEVRAEIYMSRKDFELLNNLRKKNGETLFANARNATSGSVKLLDSCITAQRKLSCIVHSFGMIKGEEDFETQSEFLEYAKQWGFCVDKHTQVCRSINEVIDYCQKYQNLRETIPYEVDGVVIKVNSLKQQKELGETRKSPRWAVAYKFPASQATTVVKDLVIQVGRTGVLTPVAELKPVECAGVKISRSTLHNFDEVKRLGIKKGDRVLIERAGDVIPKIIKVVEESSLKNQKAFLVPEKCPSCHGVISKENTKDVAYRCVNPSCFGQLERSIVHFASRGALDIEGLGPAVVEQLLENNLISDLADIYFLQLEQLLSLELFAQKRAGNLLTAINESKTKPLSKLLFALGISNVGEKAAFLIAQRFMSLDKVAKATADEFQGIHGIGLVMAQSLVQFFKSESAKRVMKKLKQTGVCLEEPVSAKVTGIFLGKKFVLTGELNSISRIQAKEIIIGLGGDVSSSVSSKTDFVLAGKAPGSKYKQALKLEVSIINEQQFQEMINEK